MRLYERTEAAVQLASMVAAKAIIGENNDS